jgi:hypothetical protein
MSSLKAFQGYHGNRKIFEKYHFPAKPDIILQQNYPSVFTERPGRGQVRSSRRPWGLTIYELRRYDREIAGIIAPRHRLADE